MKLSINIAGREFSVGATKKSATANSFLRGEDASGGGGATMSSAYQQSVWVYACVSALAEQIAQIPFRFSRVGNAQKMRRRGLGEDIIDSGPVVDMFNRPHPQLNRFQFWELAVSWLQLRGELFVVPVSDNSRGSTRMLVLSPDQLKEVIHSNALMGWRYTSHGNQSPLSTQSFLPEELVTDRLANPFDFWRGMSPLGVARLAASTDYASAQFQKGLMQNNADTGVIVRTDQQMDEQQRVQMLAALRERKRSAGTADRPLLLWGGAEIVKPSLSSTDMQFLENRKFNRQEICAVFKIPQEIIGFTEDANKSVSVSARLNFIENRVAPLCERLEAAFDPVIKRMDPTLWGWFDIEALPVMQAARRERYASATQAFNMGVPIDECSEIFDLGLPDGLPHAGKSYLPFSLQEIGGEMAPDDISNVEPPAEDDMAKRIARLFNPVASPVQHVCTSPEGYLNSIRGSVKKKTATLNRFFFEQRVRVLENLSEEIGKSKGIEDIFDMSSENAALVKKLRTLLIADLEFGGAQLWQEIGMVDFKLAPAEAVAYLEKRKAAITGVNESTWNAIRTEVQAGLNTGESYEQIADRVKTVFNVSDQRAGVIALTETNGAINAGRFEGMKTAKVEKKAWLASNLSSSRPTHQAAAAKYSGGIPLDQPFEVGGEKLMFPGDPQGSPGNTINCRCTSVAMQGDGKAIAKFLTWEEWMASHFGFKASCGADGSEFTPANIASAIPQHGSATPKI